jgi:hypothetical protein
LISFNIALILVDTITNWLTSWYTIINVVCGFLLLDSLKLENKINLGIIILESCFISFIVLLWYCIMIIYWNWVCDHVYLDPMFEYTFLEFIWRKQFIKETLHFGRWFRKVILCFNLKLIPNNYFRAFIIFFKKNLLLDLNNRGVTIKVMPMSYWSFQLLFEWKRLYDFVMININYD